MITTFTITNIFQSPMELLVIVQAQLVDLKLIPPSSVQRRSVPARLPLLDAQRLAQSTPPQWLLSSWEVMPTAPIPLLLVRFTKP
jgi:hypothetical protein